MIEVERRSLVTPVRLILGVILFSGALALIALLFGGSPASADTPPAGTSTVSASPAPSSAPTSLGAIGSTLTGTLNSASQLGSTVLPQAGAVAQQSVSSVVAPVAAPLPAAAANVVTAPVGLAANATSAASTIVANVANTTGTAANPIVGAAGHNGDAAVGTVCAVPLVSGVLGPVDTIAPHAENAVVGTVKGIVSGTGAVLSSALGVVSSTTALGSTVSLPILGQGGPAAALSLVGGTAVLSMLLWGAAMRVVSPAGSALMPLAAPGGAPRTPARVPNWPTSPEVDASSGALSGSRGSSGGSHSIGVAEALGSSALARPIARLRSALRNGGLPLFPAFEFDTTPD